MSIVVNNAGAYTDSHLLTAPTANLRLELETNVLGPLWMPRAFAPVLAAHGGGALQDVRDAPGHTNPRTTRRYNRGRFSQPQPYTWPVTTSVSRSKSRFTSRSVAVSSW